MQPVDALEMSRACIAMVWKCGVARPDAVSKFWPPYAVGTPRLRWTSGVERLPSREIVGATAALLLRLLPASVSLLQSLSSVGRLLPLAAACVVRPLPVTLVVKTIWAYFAAGAVPLVGVGFPVPVGENASAAPLPSFLAPQTCACACASAHCAFPGFPRSLEAPTTSCSTSSFSYHLPTKRSTEGERPDPAVS